MCRRTWRGETSRLRLSGRTRARGFMDNASALPTTPPAQPHQQGEDWSYLKEKPTRPREHSSEAAGDSSGSIPG